jgi:predicted small metal-binding protein
MSLELTCPVDGCDAVCAGDSEAEILEQAEAHATDAHPDLELDEDTVQTLKDGIEEV